MKIYGLSYKGKKRFLSSKIVSHIRDKAVIDFGRCSHNCLTFYDKDKAKEMIEELVNLIEERKPLIQNDIDVINGWMKEPNKMVDWNGLSLIQS